ncbi:MAG: SDR family oxidoreductase [Planctomycetes bacterium]|nr:SDR family oxidoreductase [Planctomycetota bacterium]
MPRPPSLPPPAYLPSLPVLMAAWCCILVAAGADARAADIEEGFDGQHTIWSLADTDAPPRVFSHTLDPKAAHRGVAGEHIVLQASAGTTLRLQAPIGAASVIDEFKGSVWLRSNRPDIRLCVRITLPNFLSPHTGRPIDVLFNNAGINLRASSIAGVDYDGWARTMATNVFGLTFQNGQQTSR